MSTDDTERRCEDFLAEELSRRKPRSVGEARRGRRGEEPAEEPTPKPPIVVPDEPAEPPPLPPSCPAVPTRRRTRRSEESRRRSRRTRTSSGRSRSTATTRHEVGEGRLRQEQHISRIAREKQEAEELAAQWYEYAQQVEAQARSRRSARCRSPPQEEKWVEQSLVRPAGVRARRPRTHGNMQLYNARHRPRRRGEPGPGRADRCPGADGAAAARQQQQNGQPQPARSQEALAAEIQRLGIDLRRYGAPMSEKIGELGEYHPYVQAIMEGDDGQRDLALQAVYDLVRATRFTRKVRDSERDEQISQEDEMRRQAAGVVDRAGRRSRRRPKQSTRSWRRWRRSGGGGASGRDE